MADLMQNVQDVYKKWESRSTPNFASRRGRGRGTFTQRPPRRMCKERNNFQSSYMSIDRKAFKSMPRPPRFTTPRYDTLAEFKMVPTVIPENKLRPFMGTPCAKCFFNSKLYIEDSSVFLLGVCNVLHIPYFSRDVIPTNFSEALNIIKLNQKSLYQNVSASVLKNERVVSSIQTQIEESIAGQGDDDSYKSRLLTEWYQKAKMILGSMRSSISRVFVQLTGFCLHLIFSKVFDSILVHKGHMEILKIASDDNIPLIYLPVHRSYFDYVAVSFILYMNSLKIPFIAAYDDLYIPFFGLLLRFLGVIFIKRQFLQDKNHHLYNAVLQSYIMDCLKSGQNLQFFMENECSKSGKPQIPETYLLSTVIESVRKEVIEDAYIVPVSISYEKIMDGNLVAEQLGQCKKKENFLSMLYSFWKVFHKNFGYIRVNFGHPFSLKMYSQSWNKNESLSDGDSHSELEMKNLHSDSSSLLNEVSETVIKDLATHIIYDAASYTSLMSTHLLSFLFVSQFREGATQQQLETSMNWLRGELLNRKCDTGFTGKSLMIIKRAVDCLGNELIQSETVEMEWTSSDLENNNVKVIIYKPVLKLPHVLELRYYANFVVPIFLLESMIVTSIYASVDEICIFRCCDSKLYVYRDELIKKAIKLRDLMKYEFIAVPPCADIMLCFNDVLDTLIEKEFLHNVSGVATGIRRKKTHALSFESEEDEASELEHVQLKIDLREESINHLEFLRNVLSPFIESYWLAACSLLGLIDEIKEESVFVQEMQMLAQDKLYKGLLQYEESFSAATLRNALKLFESRFVIECCFQDNVKLVYLTDSYNCCEALNDVIAEIEEYRK